jgi:hypothetical protein
MIVSTEPRFIFIAVPKTGSSSVEQSLSAYDNAGLSQSFNKHALAMVVEEGLPADVWECSFKFAFVRDPYEWLYSWYRYRQREGLQNPGHKRHKIYTGNMSFDEFAHCFADEELMLKQSDFIRSPAGELRVDFVGRYETLQDDFTKVCEQLGIEAPPLEWVNSSGPAVACRELLSASGKRRVDDYFRQDFEWFGYEFATPSST